MRKYLLMFTVILLLMTACSNKVATVDREKSAEEQPEEQSVEEMGEDEDSIEVDKNLLSVEITLPVSFLELDGETIDIDELTKEAKEQGVKEVKQNEDGSVTYKMSKSAHKKMIEEMKESMTESINEVVNSEDFISIKEITSNKSFDEFDIIVDKEGFENSFDGFAILGLVFTTMYYQLFDGVDPDSYKVTFNYIDANTNEIFDTVIYPEAFDEFKE